MGLFFRRKVDEKSVQKQLDALFIPGEEVKYSLRQIRDLIIVTNKRLMIVDKQGLTGRKKRIISYLLNRIVMFDVENSPFLDFESEVLIQFMGMKKPLSFKISKLTDVNDFAHALFEQIDHYH